MHANAYPEHDKIDKLTICISESYRLRSMRVATFRTDFRLKCIIHNVHTLKSYHSFYKRLLERVYSLRSRRYLRGVARVSNSCLNLSHVLLRPSFPLNVSYLFPPIVRLLETSYFPVNFTLFRGSFYSADCTVVIKSATFGIRKSRTAFHVAFRDPHAGWTAFC